MRLPLIRCLSSLCTLAYVYANSLHGLNDNFCDRSDGTDELITSACAGVSISPKFSCRGSGFLNVTIPLSRVQDGVCDCCDGEDEIGSPFFSSFASALSHGAAACPNTCSKQLSLLKTDTLAAYRHISAGLRAKSDVVNILTRKKLREKQSYDGLLHEHREVQKLYYQTKFWLERDAKVEVALRLGELRSRVRKCADGFFEACDYFLDGCNVMYEGDLGVSQELLYDFPELWDEQGALPDRVSDVEEEEDQKTERRSKVGSLDPSKLGNSPHRKKSSSMSEKIEEVIRKNQAKDRMHSKLSGPQRVENSFCSFEEMDEVGFLGGEESLRVHRNVQQYLEWLTGKGGRAARKLTVEQTRAKTTLFGAYLDQGSSGYAVGLQVVFEWVGLLLAPVTVPYTQLAATWSRNSKALQRRAQYCVLSRDADGPLPNNGGGDEWAYQLPCNDLTLWLFRAVLALSEEASPLATALQYLDYNNYNFIMTHIVTRVAPILNSNMWYFRIIQQTPYYYYRFYFGDGASRLPVYRNACILREGLRVAKVEAKDLLAKIESKRREVERNGGKVDSESAPAAEGIAERVMEFLKMTFSSLAAPLPSSSSTALPDLDEDEGLGALDFGPDGSWQALTDSCLTRHEGEYEYKVCPFRQVHQDGILLGDFSHWGKKPPDSPLLGGAQSKMSSFKSRSRNKKRGQKEKKSTVTKASEYLTGLVSGDSKGEDGGGNASYTSQYYGGGTACHNGIARHAIVEYSCAAFPEIVDVVEYEMCGYALKVHTPLACTRAMEEEALRRLQQLEVVGYTDKGGGDDTSEAWEEEKKEPFVEVTADASFGGSEQVEVEVVPVQKMSSPDTSPEQPRRGAGSQKRRESARKQTQEQKPYRVTFNQ